MKLLRFLTCFLVVISYASADYCVCRDNKTEEMYQASIDYACQFGADCGPIKPDGACFQPNTTESHCTFAVNSYYEHRAMVGATCEFSGAATLVVDPPTSVSNGCVFSAMIPTPPTFSTEDLPYGRGSVHSLQISGIFVRFTIVGLLLSMWA